MIAAPQVQSRGPFRSCVERPLDSCPAIERTLGVMANMRASGCGRVRAPFGAQISSVVLIFFYSGPMPHRFRLALARLIARDVPSRYVRHQNSLGSGSSRQHRRAGLRMGRDGVGGLAPRLSASARPAVVRVLRLAGPPAASVLLVVASLRCLRARDLRGGRLDRSLGRDCHRHRGHRHVSVASARGPGDYDLRVGVLGRCERRPQGSFAGSRWSASRTMARRVSPPRWS